MLLLRYDSSTTGSSSIDGVAERSGALPLLHQLFKSYAVEQERCKCCISNVKTDVITVLSYYRFDRI